MTRVKICGLTSLDDAELAVEHGAWALGLIFHRPSPRSCRIADAELIAAAMRRRAEVCGVFVNAPLDDVVRTADRVGLTMLQLHGDEGPSYATELARRTGCRVVKAVGVRSNADVLAVRAFRQVDFHLLDTGAGALRGGTGETFDWALAARRPRGAPPLILAGGLTPENVSEAITTVSPFAVDTASGTEAEPGRKDPERVRAFFAAVAEADPVPAPDPAAPVSAPAVAPAAS